MIIAISIVSWDGLNQSIVFIKNVCKKKRFDELYDLYALRIITQDKMDCYGILGLIHDQYRPIPGRFKDYIAMPKPNMYQSLHTSVIGEDGNTFEIQIRTEEMDELAELGVAAHWRYKEIKAIHRRKNNKKLVKNCSGLENLFL